MQGRQLICHMRYESAHLALARRSERRAPPITHSASSSSAHWARANRVQYFRFRFSYFQNSRAAPPPLLLAFIIWLFKISTSNNIQSIQLIYFFLLFLTVFFAYSAANYLPCYIVVGSRLSIKWPSWMKGRLIHCLFKVERYTVSHQPSFYYFWSLSFTFHFILCL
jgi:hypothetical protein